MGENDALLGRHINVGTPCAGLDGVESSTGGEGGHWESVVVVER